MSMKMGEALLVGEPRSPHLEPMEVAAYIDGVAADSVRIRVEEHLMECAQCREELVGVSRLALRTSSPKFRHPRVWIPVAAAAVLLLVIWPASLRERATEHRESPVTTTVAPRAVAPVGLVDAVESLNWSSVPGSDLYRVRLFDADGAVLWDGETKDTLISAPASLGLLPGRSYFWKVEAQTGFGRSAASDLIEFSIRRASGR